MSSEAIAARIRPVSDFLEIGTEYEIVYRHTVQLILNEPLPELPNSGNGLAAFADVERALAPLMSIAKNRTTERVRSHLGYLIWKGLLVTDEDQEFVYLPAKHSATA